MRTFSLLMALAVVVGVTGIVNHRSAPRPPKSPKVTSARRTEPGKHAFEVSVAVKGQAQEAEADVPQQQEAAPKVVPVGKDPEPKADAEIKPEIVSPDKGRSPARVVDITADGKMIGWRITGEYQTSVEDAMHKALTLAQATVQRYLRNQEPPIQWVPALNFVQTRLVKNLTTDVTDFGGSVGIMHRVVVDVKVTPEAMREIVQQDREHGRQIVQQEREEQAKGRMLWLGKILAAIVALLAALAGYIRLDDMTKGYLSHWLRLAVFFFAAVMVLGLILIG